MARVGVGAGVIKALSSKEVVVGRDHARMTNMETTMAYGPILTVRKGVQCQLGAEKGKEWTTQNRLLLISHAIRVVVTFSCGHRRLRLGWMRSFGMMHHEISTWCIALAPKLTPCAFQGLIQRLSQFKAGVTSDDCHGKHWDALHGGAPRHGREA